MKVILDTNLYFSQSNAWFKEKADIIIGTKWNGWELLTSSKFKDKTFSNLKGAITRFLDFPIDYIEMTPMDMTKGSHLLWKRKEKASLLHDVILAELNTIRRASTIADYKKSDVFKGMRDYDNSVRKAMAVLLGSMVRKHKELKADKFSREIAYCILVANLDEIILDWIYKQYKFIPTRSKIQLYRNTPFVEGLIDFMEYRFEISGDAGRNDFNDLMFLVYLNENDYFFSTTETTWVDIYKANPIIRQKFIEVQNI